METKQNSSNNVFDNTPMLFLDSVQNNQYIEVKIN